MKARRSAGTLGSIGTNVAAAFSAASSATYISTERESRMPTRPPGSSPRRRR